MLLLPESLLADWSGIDVPEYRVVEATSRWSAEEPRASDYDLACDIATETGVIRVGHGEGLVLAPGLRPTAWLPAQSGGLIARCDYVGRPEAMDAAIACLPDLLEFAASGHLSVTSSPLVLFNSAEPGEEPLMPRLEVHLSPGQYAIGLARYAPEGRIGLSLVELRRSSG